MNRSIITVRTITMAAAFIGSVLLFATAAQAETIEGKLNGIECASHGEQCPTDRLDPHIALERDFVVQTADGKYYFITNLDRAVKARHALKMVRVEGRVSSRFNAINADEFWVKDGGKYNLTWSMKMQQDEEMRLRVTNTRGWRPILKTRIQNSFWIS